MMNKKYAFGHKIIPDIKISSDESCYITIDNKVFYIDCSIDGEEPYIAYWDNDGSNHTQLTKMENK
jgi:hypothetical protein